MPSPDSTPPPRVWALLGPRAGDNNQVLALAEALGWPFEAKPLGYTLLRRVPLLLAGAGTGRLDAASRARLGPPWPELVIAVGRRGVPVARWIKARAGGRAVLVQIGRPRAPLSWFDLVVTTPQYGTPEAANVLTLPVPMSRLTPARLREAGEAWGAGLDAYPRPRLALLLGGPSPPLRPRPGDAVDAFARLQRRAREAGGSVLVVGSRRTPPALVAAVEARAHASDVPAALLGGDAYAGLLALADEVHVTADSAAMLGDAVASGHPVGLVPVGEDRLGAARLRAWRRVRLAGGTPARVWDALARRGLVDWPRDLWFMWREAERLGLAGTPDRPARGAAPPDDRAVAERVRRLLRPDGEPPARCDRDGGPPTPARPAGRGGA